MAFVVERFHDFSYGHRVTGHENKCRHLHGHNGRVYFTCTAQELDQVGRVIDFSVIKEKLCNWVEENWDHKFLAWQKDALMLRISNLQYIRGKQPSESIDREANAMLTDSIVWLPFNPTAENMAEYLVTVVGPKQLHGTGVKLVSVRIDETIKCSATYTGDGDGSF